MGALYEPVRTIPKTRQGSQVGRGSSPGARQRLFSRCLAGCQDPGKLAEVVLQDPGKLPGQVLQQVGRGSSPGARQVTRVSSPGAWQVTRASSPVSWQVDGDFAFDIVNNFVITCVLSVNLLFLQ